LVRFDSFGAFLFLKLSMPVCLYMPILIKADYKLIIIRKFFVVTMTRKSKASQIQVISK